MSFSYIEEPKGIDDEDDSIIIDAILNSDVETIDNYLSTHKMLPVIFDTKLFDSFDPTYEFIDYIIRCDKKMFRDVNIFNNIIGRLLDSKITDKISYFIERFPDKLYLFKKATSMYAYSIVVGDTIVYTQDSSYKRFILSLIIDHVKNYITPQQVYEYLNKIEDIFYARINFGDIIKFIESDISLYLLYIIISNNSSTSVSNNIDNSDSNNNIILEYLLVVAIRLNTSATLINILTDSLDERSFYRSEDARNNITKYVRPLGYISMFEEDV